MGKILADLQKTCIFLPFSATPISGQSPYLFLYLKSSLLFFFKDHSPILFIGINNLELSFEKLAKINYFSRERRNHFISGLSKTGRMIIQKYYLWVSDCCNKMAFQINIYHGKGISILWKSQWENSSNLDPLALILLNSSFF